MGSEKSFVRGIGVSRQGENYTGSRLVWPPLDGVRMIPGEKWSTTIT